jgi:hypothetical protein
LVQVICTLSVSAAGRVGSKVSAVLAGCDGQHPLRVLVADVAHGLGVHTEAVTPACLSVVRKLMQLGFLGVAEARHRQ